MIRAGMKLLPVLLLAVQTAAIAQLRDYAIHKRGMLHESVYNTGEIGRAYDQGNGGTILGVPCFQWPGNSSVIVDGVRYNGQNNSFGGGMYLAVNAADTSGRIYAFCGGVGSSSPEAVAGIHSFPLALTRTENYPILSDGQLNPAYDPNEAEEIIVTKWASSTGLTITRTSRAWSLPDYDDFIIYEYEIENTGDRDGKPGAESTADLTDVLVAFAWGLNPSQFGYQRTYNQWVYNNFESNDMRRRWDRNRWLNYSLDRDGKPELNYFTDWASSNRYGGGLLSPQAVGFAMLYFDTLNLATVGQTAMQYTDAESLYIWTESGRLKQPYMNRVETSNLRSSKVQPYLDVALNRKLPPYRDSVVFGNDWYGRGSFNARQSKKFGVGSIFVLGPYTVPYGTTIRFALAQVAGYGAASLAQTNVGLMDEGGSCGELCGEPWPALSFFPVPNWTQETVYGYDNTVYGSSYLTTYPLPEYVNSNTVTIRDVTDRAIEAYTGNAFVTHDSVQYWPELAPSRGVYQLPTMVPSPAIDVSSNDLAQNVVAWTPSVEAFAAPRLVAALSHYEVYKANHPLGPWAKLDSIGIADARYYANGEYKLTDPSTRVGESFYYSVVSVDAAGNRAGRTNVTLHETQIGGTETLEEVIVVPNPFIVRSGFSGVTSTGADASGKIGFYNLPKQCIIRVFSYSGQLVQTIEHDSGLYSTEYMQVTRNNQLLASGVYFYVVETPTGDRTNGKFVIIH